jgi:hypothetical protein
LETNILAGPSILLGRLRRVFCIFGGHLREIGPCGLAMEADRFSLGKAITATQEMAPLTATINGYQFSCIALHAMLTLDLDRCVCGQAHFFARLTSRFLLPRLPGRALLVQRLSSDAVYLDGTFCIIRPANHQH